MDGFFVALTSRRAVLNEQSVCTNCINTVLFFEIHIYISLSLPSIWIVRVSFLVIWTNISGWRHEINSTFGRVSHLGMSDKLNADTVLKVLPVIRAVSQYRYCTIVGWGRGLVRATTTFDLEIYERSENQARFIFRCSAHFGTFRRISAATSALKREMVDSAAWPGASVASLYTVKSYKLSTKKIAGNE